MAYNGSIELISGIKAKNNGTFPLVDAKDVRVDDGTRLDETLTAIEEKGSASKKDVSRLSELLGIGVIQGWEKGRITIAVSGVDKTSLAYEMAHPDTSNLNWEYVIVPCSPGEMFTLNVNSNPASARGFTFTDGLEARNVLLVGGNLTYTNYVVTAPDNAAYLILQRRNENLDKLCYRGAFDGDAIADPNNMNLLMTGADDMSWSWWTFPLAVSFHGVRNRLYWGYTSRNGFSGIACYDFDTHEITKNNLKIGANDNHNAPAIHVLGDGTILACYATGHGKDNGMHVRRSVTPESIEKFSDDLCLGSTHGFTSYCQLVECAYEAAGAGQDAATVTKLFMFYRTSDYGWSYRYSLDGGVTWSEEVLFLTATYKYYCLVKKTTDSSRLRLVMYSNPGGAANEIDPRIRQGFMDVSTGNIYNSDGTTLLGSSAIPHTSFTVLVDVTQENPTQRLFDAAVTAPERPLILYAPYVGSTDVSTYKIYDAGTVTDIVAAGACVTTAVQLGVCWLGNDKIVAAWADNAKDHIDIYAWNGSALTLEKSVVEEARGTKNIRNTTPHADSNGEAFVWQRGTYTDRTIFNCDARVYDAAAETEVDVLALQNDMDKLKNTMDSLIYLDGAEEKAPYIMRASGGNADIGNHEKNKLVGGTVCWNQLVHEYATATQAGITLTNDGTGNLTASGTSTGEGNHIFASSVPMYKGHKYLIALGTLTASSTANIYLYSDAGSTTVYSKNVGSTHPEFDIVTPSDDYTVKYYLDYGSSGNTISGRIGPMLIDLTQLFGYVIAEYIYSLEQLSAGAGVSWFKRLFDQDYYGYNAGQLISVKASRHDMVGFNAWDEQWEVGRFDVTTGEDVAWQQIRAKNLTPIIGGAQYYFKATYSLWMLFYDASGNIIQTPNVQGSMYLDGNAATLYPNTSFTPPQNARYMRFFMNSDYGAVYNNDICFSLSGAKNGEYEAYEKHAYPLDANLELRGLPQLDENGALYYSGDTYESDGTVVRNYAYADMGALTWAYSAPDSWLPYGMFYASLSGKKAGTNNVRCALYATIQSFSNDKVCFGNANDSTIYVIDSAYNGDAAAFKTAMDGKQLLYEKAAASTETAAPFEDIQWVNADGTEAYIDARAVPVPVGHDTTYLTQIDSGFISNLSDQVKALETSAWAQKRVLVIGDSISTDVYGGYKKWVTDLIDEGYFSREKTTNDSIGGTGFVAIAENDSSTTFISRLQTHTPANYDAVILFGGINDFLSDVNYSTFQTAVDTFMAYLAANYAHARLAVLSPLTTYINTQNSAGHTQQEYSAYIRQAAKAYCLPVLNLTDESGYYPYVTEFRNTWTLLPPWDTNHDGIHPSLEWERDYLCPMIKKFLNGIIA